MKYRIEADITDLNIDMTDEQGWRHADMLQAEGDTLEQCLDSAVVFLSDQDGGEAGEYCIGDFSTSIYKSLVNRIEDSVKYGSDCY